MRRSLVLTAAAAWAMIAFAAILNGTLRQAVLIPLLGDPVAQVLSIAILVGLIAAVAAVLVRRRWRDLPSTTLLAIGIVWAIGAIAFEFALGRLVLGMPWSELLAAYDVRTGALWPLAPLAMIASPLLASLAFAGKPSAARPRAG